MAAWKSTISIDYPCEESRNGCHVEVIWICVVVCEWSRGDSCCVGAYRRANGDVGGAARGGLANVPHECAPMHD